MFKLPDLPFAKTALAPAMSAETLELHHGKHHAGYVKKTNAALKERPDAPRTLEDVVRVAVRDKDLSLFNNAAQAWNHAFFWQSLSPEAEPTPKGELRSAIESAFGSFGAFAEEARAKGEGHFASGWLWLAVDRSGKVALEDLHDAQTPIVDPRVTPLLACDLWEHAYYLDYKNERGRFLDAFWTQLANWSFAERQFAAARNGGEGVWRYPV